MDIESFKAAFMRGGALRAHFEGSVGLTHVALSEARAAVDLVGDPVARGELGTELRNLAATLPQIIDQGQADPRGAVAAMLTMREAAADLQTRAANAPLPMPADRTGRANRIEQWIGQVDPKVELALQETWHFVIPELTRVRREFKTAWEDVDDGDLGVAEQLLLQLERLTKGILDDRDALRSQKKVVDGLEADLQWRLQAIEGALAAKALGDPPVGDMARAINAHAKAKTAWALAKSRSDWYAAEVALLELGDTVKTVLDLRQLQPPQGLDDEKRAELAKLHRLYFEQWRPIMAEANEINFGIDTDALGDLGQVGVKFRKAAGVNVMSTMRNPPNYGKALEAVEVMKKLMPAIRELAGDRLDAPLPRPEGARNLAELDELNKRLQALRARTKQLDRAAGSEFRNLVGDAIRAWGSERDSATRRALAGQGAGLPLPFETALDELEAAQDRFQAAMDDAAKGRIGDYANMGLNPAQMRAVLQPLAALAPEAFRELPNDQLDAMVATFGGKASGKEEQALVKAAMMARYGLDAMDGTLSSKALPRLYEVFGMVPESHVKANDKLKKVTRHRPAIGEKASYYQESEDYLFLSLQRTGLGSKVTFQKTETLDQDPDVDPDFKITGNKVRRFDAVTLHEIGHAVDAGEKFMAKVGASPAFGGWRNHKIPEVAKAVGEGKNFFTDFDKVPNRALRTYLELILEGKKAGQARDALQAGLETTPYGADITTREALMGDPGLKQAEADRLQMTQDGWNSDLAVESQQRCSRLVRLDSARVIVNSVLHGDQAQSKPLADAVDDFLNSVLDTKDRYQVAGNTPWQRMAKHAAVKVAVDIRCKGDKGLWDKKSAGAAKGKIGSRVYQEAYKGTWVSYEIGARKQGVSSYQFRADGEWFAEAYSTYFLGKLPPAHPLYTWLQGQTAPA